MESRKNSTPAHKRASRPYYTHHDVRLCRSLSTNGALYPSLRTYIYLGPIENPTKYGPPLGTSEAYSVLVYVQILVVKYLTNVGTHLVAACVPRKRLDSFGHPAQPEPATHTARPFPAKPRALGIYGTAAPTTPLCACRT